MKLLRNESGTTLVNKLRKIGYVVSRQKGSHIRLTKNYDTGDHHITIPNHNPIKIGTLSNILKDVSQNMGVSLEELIVLLS